MTYARPNLAAVASHRSRTCWRLGALCAGLLALAGCKRADEAELRALLAGWVPLGKTVSFSASRGCAAGLFKVVSPRITSRMPIARSVPEAATILKSRDQVAIKAPSLTPDSALLQLIEVERPTGMKMRMAALEGRACMDSVGEAAFTAALVSPDAVVLLDRSTGLLALVNAQDGLLIAAMGAQ